MFGAGASQLCARAESANPMALADTKKIAAPLNAIVIAFPLVCLLSIKHNLGRFASHLYVYWAYRDCAQQLYGAMEVKGAAAKPV